LNCSAIGEADRKRDREIKSRRMRWVRHVTRMEGERNVCKVVMGRPEGKRPLGRPRRRWKDGIRMDLREIGWENFRVDPVG
jgi:hypothetical protein